MTVRRPAVSTARWNRGLAASRRLGRRLAKWEQRARALREDTQPDPSPKRERAD